MKQSRLLVTLMSWKTVAFGMLVFIAGCGGKNEATVSGAVTLDGKPLTTGNVVFHPAVDGPVGYGTIDSTGRYTLQTGDAPGLVPGSYIITVSAIERPSAEELKVNEYTLPKMLTPMKYNKKEETPLKFDVKPGTNAIDLALGSK